MYTYLLPSPSIIIHLRSTQQGTDAQRALMRGLLPLCEGLAVLCNGFPFNASAWDPVTTRALDWTACMNGYIFCNLVRALEFCGKGKGAESVVYAYTYKHSPSHPHPDFLIPP